MIQPPSALFSGSVICCQCLVGGASLLFEVGGGGRRRVNTQVRAPRSDCREGSGRSAGAGRRSVFHPLHPGPRSLAGNPEHLQYALNHTADHSHTAFRSDTPYPPFECVLREGDHDLRVDLILSARRLVCENSSAVITFALRVDNNAPFIFRIELRDLQLEQTRLRAEPWMPDVDLRSTQALLSRHSNCLRRERRVSALMHFPHVRTRSAGVRIG